MHLLTLAVFALFSGAALAGSGGLRPAAGFAHVTGQVWEMTAIQSDGLSVKIQLKLSDSVASDVIKTSSPTYIYAAQSLIGGGNINFYPREKGIDATVVMDKTNVLRCFAHFDLSKTVASGYLLYGTSEGTNQQLREAQEAPDFSRQALLQSIKRVGAGRCTLKRLR